MYKVVFTQRALKDIENIDKETQNRIATKLKEYSKEPLRYARRLISPKIGTYRFRVGDYRVFSSGSVEYFLKRIGGYHE